MRVISNGLTHSVSENLTHSVSENNNNYIMLEERCKMSPADKALAAQQTNIWCWGQAVGEGSQLSPLHVDHCVRASTYTVPHPNKCNFFFFRIGLPCEALTVLEFSLETRWASNSELRILRPASASQILGLKACTTTPPSNKCNS